AVGRGPAEIGKFQFHENLAHAPTGFFLGQIGHELLKKFGQALLALFQRLEIARKSLFGAERFPRPVRFDRSIVNSATQIEELAPKFAEKIDQVRTGETLKLSACLHAHPLHSPPGPSPPPPPP